MRWILYGLGRAAGFLVRGALRALDDPQTAQRHVLERIVGDLRRTAMGRELGIDTVQDFLDTVPPRSWEELSPWLDRHRSGEPGVVTRHRVLFYETTSGSSGASKFVPYTAGLRSVFSRMFLLWAHDLLVNGPGLETGCLYFSVSPSFDDRAHTDDGTPVGLEDDRDYLDGWLRPFLAPFVVSPQGLASERDPDRFQTRLAEALLDADRLEVVSVWNPTFFSVILDRIEGDKERFVSRLPASRRVGLASEPVDWTTVWPSLKVVSCWADGHAAPAAASLAARLPGVMVQPKGLLATEAPITVPMVGVDGGVPLIDSVYLELMDGERVLPLHEGEVGSTYELLVTQPAGLIRYRLGDRVTVTGHRGATPTLRFAGRTGGISDLVGEKLHPSFVGDVLEEIAGEHAFRTLVPLRVPCDHYALLLDAPAPDDLAQRLDEALCRAHHYQLARRLGQLGPPEIVTSPLAPTAFLEAHAGGAARLGDIKHRFLVVRPSDAWVTPLRAPNPPPEAP